MERTRFLKIGGAMVTAFIISSFAMKTVFIFSSPRMRPYTGTYFANNIRTAIFSVSEILQQSLRSISRLPDNISNNTPIHKNLLVEQSPKDIIQTVQAIPFNTTVKGIYAKESTHTNYMVMKENEIEWIRYTVKINGKTVIVQIPKGERQPSSKALGSFAQ